MNILHVITDLKVGGVPLHLLRLARYLIDTGERCRVVSLAPLGPVAERLIDAGATCVSCDARGAWDVGVIGRLANHIRDAQPDVVHAMLFHANIAARLACLEADFTRERLICEIQTVEVERPWHLSVDRWTQRLCRCIVGNSPSVIEHLARVGGIDPERLVLIPGCVDVDAISAAAPLPRERFGAADDEALLLWVGRLDPVKGLDTLIDAFARLPDSAPARLLIAGTGHFEQRLRQQIDKRGLRGRVALLGARDDVPRLLRTADMFVFPSRSEGLPNALLEAMAAGLPIVTCDAPGCRDLIRHNVEGLLVPIDGAAALAHAMLQLLHDKMLGNRLGNAARDAVKRNFIPTKCFPAYRDLYQQLNGESSARANA